VLLGVETMGVLDLGQQGVGHATKQLLLQLLHVLLPAQGTWLLIAAELHVLRHVPRQGAFCGVSGGCTQLARE
jgi:hypothetical protein